MLVVVAGDSLGLQWAAFSPTQHRRGLKACLLEHGDAKVGQVGHIQIKFEIHIYNMYNLCIFSLFKCE